MAELKCKDGTIVQISDETEKELRKAFGEKTYPVNTWFRREDGLNPFVKLVQISSTSVALITARSVLGDKNYQCNGSIAVDNLYKVPLSTIKKLTVFSIIQPIKVKVVEDN